VDADKDIYRSNEPPLLARRRTLSYPSTSSAAFRRLEHGELGSARVDQRARIRRRRGEHNPQVVRRNKILWFSLFALVLGYGVFLAYATRQGLFRAKPKLTRPAVTAAPELSPTNAETAFLEIPIESHIRDWKRALELSREGAVAAEAGKLDIALQKLQRAVELAPDLLVAREELARYWERQKNYPQAEREWRSVLSRDPEKITARIRLASVYLAAGENEAALDTARWVLENDSYDKAALDTAATALIALRRPQEAVGFLKRLAAIERDDAAVRIKLGLAYLSLNDLKNAEATFREVLKMDAANSVAFYNLAVTHARKGSAPDAVDLLLEAARRFGAPFVLSWTKSEEFDSIREHPAFKSFVEQVSPPESAPTEEETSA
jgi:tetratricopeptide (TPR) repeat protein